MVEYNVESYKDFLHDIYGDWIDRFLNFNKKHITFLDFKEIIAAMNESESGINFKVKETCKTCKDEYNKIQPNGKKFFFDRNMDFPSWLGTLDFTNLAEPRKEIIILGESVTGKFKEIKDIGLKGTRKLNIAFEFGTTFTQENISETQNDFWKRIRELLGSEPDTWLKKIYISDVAFCNCEKSPVLINNCTESYLLKHIRFINPKLIILLGDETNKFFISRLKKDSKRLRYEKIDFSIDLDSYQTKNREFNRNFYNSKNFRAGKIYFDETDTNSCHFLAIPHTSRQNRYYFNESEKVWKDIKDKLQNHAVFKKWFN